MELPLNNMQQIRFTLMFTVQVDSGSDDMFFRDGVVLPLNNMPQIKFTLMFTVQVDSGKW